MPPTGGHAPPAAFAASRYLTCPCSLSTSIIRVESPNEAPSVCNCEIGLLKRSLDSLVSVRSVVARPGHHISRTGLLRRTETLRALDTQASSRGCPSSVGKSQDSKGSTRPSEGCSPLITPPPTGGSRGCPLSAAKGLHRTDPQRRAGYHWACTSIRSMPVGRMLPAHHISPHRRQQRMPTVSSQGLAPDRPSASKRIPLGLQIYTTLDVVSPVSSLAKGLHRTDPQRRTGYHWA